MRYVGLICLLIAPVLGAETPTLRGTIERMAKATSAWSPTFSPDSQQIAFVSDMSGIPQVWISSSKGGFPTRITDLSDTVSSVSWSPNGKWLAVSAAPGGGMNNQIYLVSPDGTEVKRITAGGQETSFGGVWQRNGDQFAYSSNVNSGASLAPHLYSASADQTRQAGKAEGLNRVYALDSSGRSMLVGRLAGRGNNNVYLIDIASNQEQLLTQHDGPGTFFAQFGRSEEDVYLGHNKDRDKIAFGKVDGRGGITTLVHRDDAELENFRIVPNSERVVLLWNNHGRSEIEVYDVRTAEQKPIHLPIDVVRSITVSPDGRHLGVSGSGSTDSNNIYVVDLSTLQVSKITRTSRPGVDASKLVTPELRKFLAHDGLELSGWLYQPPGSSRANAYVVSFHGGPEGQERPSFRSVYQALLASGIGVFAPNIRGSSGFGKEFVNLDNRELRFNANRDIATSAEFLVESGLADRKRIGIIGGSYGGYAVMVGVTEYPDLFAAGVNLFGVVNFETFFENTEPWMAAISGTEYGDPVTQKTLLQKLSPIHKLDQVQTPLLVLHGANDTNVPVIEAEQVVAELERRKVPVKYILFEDEGHGFRKEKNRVTSDVEATEWFVKYLSPKVQNP